MAHGVFLMGTSHVGKSSCAALLGRKAVSTDKMGRHPGRPWTGVPDPVIEYYETLSDASIDWFLRVHHQNVRPVIAQAVSTLRAAGAPFAVEGAALRPEFLADWAQPSDTGVLLYADEATLARRIGQSAKTAAPDLRKAIDAFTRRSLRENAAMLESATDLGLARIDVSSKTPAEVAQYAQSLIANAG